MSTFRVLYRTPSQTTTGYYSEVEAATGEEAIWETAKTLDPSAILVAVIQQDAPAAPATEGTTQDATA